MRSEELGHGCADCLLFTYWYHHYLRATVPGCALCEGCNDEWRKDDFGTTGQSARLRCCTQAQRGFDRSTTAATLLEERLGVELFANRPPQSGNLLPKFASCLPTANLQFAFRLLPENP